MGNSIYRENSVGESLERQTIWAAKFVKANGLVIDLTRWNSQFENQVHQGAYADGLFPIPAV